MDVDHVFVCGNPALDFAATLRARRSLRFEMFVTPDRLDAWSLESGIVDEVSPCREADVERARTVREAIYQLVTVRRLGEPYAAEALDALNAAAREQSAAPRLTPTGRWTTATPGEALATLARQAVELLSGPDVPLLKDCGNHEQDLPYLIPGLERAFAS